MNTDREVYVGPRPFQSTDRSFFFGREREARDLIGLVISSRAVLLHSPPGAGKTSLLNALLLPHLQEEGFEVLPITRVGRSIGAGDPHEIRNIYIFNAISGFGQNSQSGDHLAQVTLNQYLAKIERTSDEFGEPRPLAIIFDQLEELFTSYPERWGDRKEFFEEIGLALQRDALLRVVFSMQEDYIGELDSYLFLLPERLRTFRLERLRKQAAIAAVEEPLRDTALSFAPGVAQELVDNLLRITVKTAMGISEAEGQFVEPVQLQVVCQALWERSQNSEVRTITMEDLSDFGNVNATLSSFYEKAIQTAISATGITEGELRRWFDKALITPAGTRGIVFRSREETGGIPNAAVGELENQHIIRAELRGGQRWYELSHDRFIEPIRESNERWFLTRASHTDQRRQWLEAKADEWVRLGRHDSGLLNESELLEAQAWLSSADAAQLSYNDGLLALVQASAALPRRARFQRLIRRLILLMIILVLVTLSLALFAFLQYRRARKLEQLLEQHSIRAAISNESFHQARLKLSSLQSGYPNYIE